MKRTAILSLLLHQRDLGDGDTAVDFYNNREDFVDQNGAELLEKIDGGDDPYENGVFSDKELIVVFDDETDSVTLSRGFDVFSASIG